MEERDFSDNAWGARAPTKEEWAGLSPEERADVVANLPSESPRQTEPEGDAHRLAKADALDVLERFFKRAGRSVYLSSELPVYYPGEWVFAPDLLAVLDVEIRRRNSWVVSHEGKGLDFVLEVHVAGSTTKDFFDNVQRYAALGIPEYFAYDPVRGRLAGWRLAEDRQSPYRAIVPQVGLWKSEVLDLEVASEKGQLQFLYRGASLLGADDWIRKMSSMVDSAVARAEEEARRAEEEARRAEEEARRAEEEARRAENEARRADEEARRSDDLTKRLEEATLRAEQLARKLRAHGMNPDDER